MSTLANKGAVAILVALAGLAVASLGASAFLSLRSPRFYIPALIALSWILARALFPSIGTTTIDTALKISALIICAAVLHGFFAKASEADRKLYLNALLAGCLLSCAYILLGLVLLQTDLVAALEIERADRRSFFNIGTIVLVMSAPAVFFHLKQNRPVSAYTYILFLGTLSLIVGSLSATVAFAIGLLAYFVTLLGKKRSMIIISSICVLWILVTPVTIPAGIHHIGENLLDFGTSASDESVGNLGSAVHRYYIWKFASERALENPIIGWGLDTARDIPGGEQEVGVGRQLLPLHPHNAIIQIWLELGFVGLVVFGLVVAGAFIAVCRRMQDHSLTAIQFTSLCLIFVLLNGTYGIWQSWWIAVMGIVISLNQLIGPGSFESNGQSFTSKGAN